VNYILNYYGNKTEKDRIHGACTMHGEMGNASKILCRKFEEKNTRQIYMMRGM
jgi:hypothetical protein